MKNGKLKKLISKTSTGIIVTILTFVIVFGAVFTVSNLTLASDSLPGIVDIRNDIANTGDSYRVLEIVPELEAAQFGFLVGGEEPLDVDTLYDSTTKDWMSWQEYFAKNTESMNEAKRIEYLEKLVLENREYIHVGEPTDADAYKKPMWYKAYAEKNITADNAERIIEGGKAPVYGWLISNDSRDIAGWNAKFSVIDGIPYEDLMKETIPYYIVDYDKTDAEVALTKDAITGGDSGISAYPDHYYIYKKELGQSYYVAAGTFGEIKEDFLTGGADSLVDVGDETALSEYYILKFKRLEERDYAGSAGPYVYTASDFVYLQKDAPYTIPDQTDKGHSLTKPAQNIYFTGGLYTNEMFKQYSLDIDLEDVADYEVDVLTVTPGELNTMNRDDLTAYLATIDFIYINPGSTEYMYLNDDTLDLDKEAVELIFEKICNEKTPCIVDYYLRELGISNSSVSNTYVYALACMLMQEDYRDLLSGGEFNPDIIEGELAGWVGTIVSTNSYNYVNGNVMVINSTLTNNKLTDNFYGAKYSDDVVSAAYANVLEEINLENLYRTADQTAGYDELDTDIYKSTVVRYIINYVSKRSIETKTTIEVLEIQPGNVKYPDTKERPAGDEGAVSDIDLDIATIKSWLGKEGQNVKINITTMNTMEFIGTIEDLNSKYDMIYIGADIYGLQQRKSSSQQRQIPDYMENEDYDSKNKYYSMDYLVYTNIGGLTKIKAQFAGHLDTDYYEAKVNEVNTEKDKDGKIIKQTVKSNVIKNCVNSTVLARYNGNDITPDKHNALVDYVKGTYPVVISNRLCSSSTAPSEESVDNCTYLYSFLKEHLKDSNVFTVDEVKEGNNANFKFYANRGKLSIGSKAVVTSEESNEGGTAFVVPGTYAENDENTTQGHLTYIKKESDGRYYLKYKFTITNDGAVYDSTRYKAALYLDSNSDGKFSAEYENLADITLTHVASGKVVKNGELIAGEQYTLTRQVPETFSGVLTWKVEVSQTSNKFIRDSITGYTRLAETKKETIKVLQIRRDGGSPLVLEKAIGNTKYKSGSTTEYEGNNETLRKLVWGGFCDTDKVEYEGITKDFEFHFTTMTNAEFSAKYEPKDENATDENATEDEFDLMDYDMLVLGFYDSYDLRYSAETDISYKAVNATKEDDGKSGIKEFIDSGKSVLFAHDTTSVTAVSDYKNYYYHHGTETIIEYQTDDKGNVKYNWKKEPIIKKTYTQNVYKNIYTNSYGANVWGYYLNMYIRDMVGLDTYGITAGVKDGIDYDLINSGIDLSTTEEGRELMAALENNLDKDGYYEIGKKPLAYLPESNKKKTVPQTQGFLYNWMDWHWRADDDTTYRNIRAKYNTDRAERVNEGQITTYPYYLDETIDITRTHHQYFTLDLYTDDDGDGETDLVVWYTMGGKVGDGSHQDRKYDEGVDDEGNPVINYWYNESNFDNASEKDVMNSYYIYNKGNITYTGFGDFDNDTWRDRAVIVEECKLFVNTLVAAYNASTKEPQITVYESEDNLTPATTFYEYGDVDNNVAFRADSQKMYFQVSDMNVIRGTKTASADYYVALKPDTVATNATSYTANIVQKDADGNPVKDAAGNVVTVAKTFSVFKDASGQQFIKLTNDLKTYTTTGQETANNALECGVKYYVDIPTSVFDIPGVDGQNVNTFMVGAKTQLKKTGTLTGKETIINTSTTYSKVDFVHLELFPLD